MPFVYEYFLLVKFFEHELQKVHSQHREDANVSDIS